MASGKSIVEYLGDHKQYRCGYCGHSDSNYSHGLWAHSLTVQDYEDLIDRGWRRSGKYCYKPTMKVTCCPHYTIKQEVSKFKMNKSHKKVIKMVNRYLIHGTRKGDEPNDKDKTSNSPDLASVENLERMENIVPSDLKLKEGKVKEMDTTSRVGNSSKGDNSIAESPLLGASALTEESGDKSKPFKQETMETETKKSQHTRKGDGPDPTKPPCQKAKNLRKERKFQKMASQGIDLPAENQNPQQKELEHTDGKSLEDYLNEPNNAEHVAHRLETRLVLVNSTSDMYTGSFAESYEVFKKYQMAIHKEAASDCTEYDFTQFLADSPLKAMKPVGGPEQGYGSFHQQYLLDGKIIAVGVIDVLPHCMSSVYLYYDPKYRFLSLGTYSALREIAFVRELHNRTPEIQYYYMGYYIHSCPKMIYKGQYYPSFLACPEVFTWVPIEKCRPKLDASCYAKLEEDETREDTDGKVDLARVLVLHESEAMPYQMFRMLNPLANDDEEVMEYAKMAGKRCAERMLLFRK